MELDSGFYIWVAPQISLTENVSQGGYSFGGFLFFFSCSSCGDFLAVAVLGFCLFVSLFALFCFTVLIAVQTE